MVTERLGQTQSAELPPLPGLGAVTDFTGNGVTAGTAAAQFDQAYGCAVAPTGEVIVTDHGNKRIVKVSTGGVPSTVSQFSTVQPVAMVVADHVADTVLWGGTGTHSMFLDNYVTNTHSTFAGDGTAADTDGTGAAARFRTPQYVAKHTSGSLYYTSENGGERRRTPR
jgi:hypothetical protein